MTSLTRTLSLFAILCLAAHPAAARQRSSGAKAATAPPAGLTDIAPKAPPKTAVKAIAYDPHEVAHVNTKLRFTTLIILPKDEVILDYVCGDANVWVISGEQNFAYVKPTQEETRTNLNLVTAAGNVYSFVLSEVSGKPGAEADLKVFVEPKSPASRDVPAGPRRFVAAKELEASKQELEASRAETGRVKAASKEEARADVLRFIGSARYPYEFPAGKKPFFVRAMFHDDSFTYILARPEETPVLYELRDGEPNLVNFEYSGGMFIVSKVLESGYLALGKKRLHFKRQE